MSEPTASPGHAGPDRASSAPKPWRDEQMHGPIVLDISLWLLYGNWHAMELAAQNMPTNLHGPGDNYHPDNSHVIPALIRKFHEAKTSNAPTVTVWGTGTPKREFLYSEDMADACVYLMNLPDDQYTGLLESDESKSGKFEPSLVNIGVGHDITIKELALLVKSAVGYVGDVTFGTSKSDGTPRKLMSVDLLTRSG